MTDKQNIEAVLERIEALPPHKTVWTYQSDIQPFDTSDLWQLAASYREQAKRIKALQAFADFVLAEFWLGVPDAGACQDKAVALGLLEGVPQTCYRFTDILTGKPLAAFGAMEGESDEE